MKSIAEEIKSIVDRETKAWSTKDVNLLLSIFHPDMVWVWPKDNKSHNPVDWELPLGKFDRGRWSKIYEKMFNRYDLIKNVRKIVDIKVSNEENGAFAVVDVDTLWKDKSGNEMHWLGRAGKVYVRVNKEWKMIFQTGLLIY